MKKRSAGSILIHALASSALASLAVTTHAQSNLGFLDNTPLSHFRKADIASLTQAVEGVRDYGKDGDAVNWANSGGNTRIAATLTPSTSEQRNRMCRTIATNITAKGQSILLKPMYCKSASGSWQLQRR